MNNRGRNQSISFLEELKVMWESASELSGNVRSRPRSRTTDGVVGHSHATENTSPNESRKNRGLLLDDAGILNSSASSESKFDTTRTAPFPISESMPLSVADLDWVPFKSMHAWGNNRDGRLSPPPSPIAPSLCHPPRTDHHRTHAALLEQSLRRAQLLDEPRCFSPSYPCKEIPPEPSAEDVLSALVRDVRRTLDNARRDEQALMSPPYDSPWVSNSLPQSASHSRALGLRDEFHSRTPSPIPLNYLPPSTSSYYAGLPALSSPPPPHSRILDISDSSDPSFYPSLPYISSRPSTPSNEPQYYFPLSPYVAPSSPPRMSRCRVRDLPERSWASRSPSPFWLDGDLPEEDEVTSDVDDDEGGGFGLRDDAYEGMVDKTTWTENNVRSYSHSNSLSISETLLLLDEPLPESLALLTISKSSSSPIPPSFPYFGSPFGHVRGDTEDREAYFM